jgi:peptidoglycan/LPS O-acetylase OafA/YrhL
MRLRVGDLGERPADRRARLPEADVLRSLACVAFVTWHVLVHVARSAPPGQQESWLLASQFFVWGGPVFFFLAALLGFHRHPEGERDRGFWARRLLLIGLPYLVWSAVYLLLDLPTFRGMSAAGMLRTVGLSLLFGVAQLAFVNALFQFYLCFPLLRWLWNRADRWALVLSAFLIGVGWLIGGWRLFRVSLPPAAYSSVAAFLPGWLPYVALGALLAPLVGRLGRLAPRPVWLWFPIACTVAGALLYLGRPQDGDPYAGAIRWPALAATLLILPFLLRAGYRARIGDFATITREFSRHTPAVFFAHLLPLRLAALLVPGGWSAWAHLAVYVLTTAVGTGLIIRFFKRNPAAMLAVGMLDRPKRVALPAGPPAAEAPEYSRAASAG